MFERFCFIPASLAMKVHHHLHLLADTKVSKVWNKWSLTYNISIEMTNDNIESIEKGLRLGHLLKLPKGLSFGCEQITHLLVSEGCIRPFKHLW